MTFDHPLSDLIRRRHSCRTFAAGVEDPALRGELNTRIRSLPTGFDTRLRFELVEIGDLKKNDIFPTGTYGLIKGAATFIAGVMRPAEGRMWEDFGFAMELAVLHATDLGLATCWIGGVFDRAAFSRVLRVESDEIVPAVTVVGRAAGSPVLRDRLVRWGARGDRRLDPGRLFFHERFDRPLPGDLFPDLLPALENVRLGPSASNKQPWRIRVHRDRGHPSEKTREPLILDLYLKRDPVYRKIVPKADLQRIDMGIAMCHLEMSLRETGTAFERVGVPPPDRFEPVVSYRIDR